jgi:hypothetical protein
MEKLADDQVANYRKRDESKYDELTFAEVLNLIREGAEYGDTFYVRWSESISLDRETGHSIDHANGYAHDGLSACEVEDTFTSDDLLFEKKAIKKALATLTRYYFNGEGGRGWIVIGQRNGFDSDGMSLLRNSGLEVWGYLSEEDVEKWKAYTRDDEADLEDYFDLGALKS